MTITANCKINIGLDVLERREDGFHSLSTVMIPVRGLYDTLTIEHSNSGDVEFSASGIAVDCPADANLCIKAYRLMRERYDIGAVAIHLEKCVPFGAGLGGGSADATAVILAINSLFNLNLSEDTLIALASELGSDTAFFVRNSPQLCTGRGEVMESIELDLAGKYLVLVKPDEGVSTREAYAGVKPHYPTTPLSELIARPIDEWQGSIKNDFERHIFLAHPLLGSIKDELLKAGATYAAMSGSGSTIFGIFGSKPNLEGSSLCKFAPYIFEI